MARRCLASQAIRMNSENKDYRRIRAQKERWGGGGQWMENYSEETMVGRVSLKARRGGTRTSTRYPQQTIFMKMTQGVRKRSGRA